MILFQMQFNNNNKKLRKIQKGCFKITLFCLPLQTSNKLIFDKSNLHKRTKSFIETDDMMSKAKTSSYASPL